MHDRAEPIFPPVGFAEKLRRRVHVLEEIVQNPEFAQAMIQMIDTLRISLEERVNNTPQLSIVIGGKSRRLVRDVLIQIAKKTSNQQLLETIAQRIELTDEENRHFYAEHTSPEIYFNQDEEVQKHGSVKYIEPQVPKKVQAAVNEGHKIVYIDDHILSGTKLKKMFALMQDQGHDFEYFALTGGDSHQIQSKRSVTIASDQLLVFDFLVNLSQELSQVVDMRLTKKVLHNGYAYAKSIEDLTESERVVMTRIREVMKCFRAIIERYSMV